MTGSNISDLVWVAALVPFHGGEIYDGIRLTAHKTEEESYRDLLAWCDDAPEFTSIDATKEFLNESEEVRNWKVEACILVTPPPIAGTADAERESKLDAERVTLEFATKSARRLDAGRRCIEDSPLFGGDRQGDLF